MRVLAVLLLCAISFARAEGWNPARQQAAHQVPEWARAGKIRFALWYGGILDLGKGILSRWNFFYPSEPDMIEAATHWYDLDTVEHLKALNVSAIWVCWSNGYSIGQERIQWTKLAPYVAACHQAGVRVVAYMSIGNMFWDEMFKHEPQSKGWVARNAKGEIRLYGNNPNRYMADILNPAWQEYLRKRIDAALDAGVDALMYDNSASFYGREKVERLAADLLDYARRRKPGVLFCSNYNRGMLTWARAQNMITSEEGSVPGLYEQDPLPNTAYVYKFGEERSFAKFNSDPVTIDGKPMRLVNNIGLAQYLWGVAEGWRPVIIEEGAWNGLERLSAILSPRQYQLSIAESAAFGFGFEIQFLGRFQRDLYHRRPEAIAARDAIGRYNGFWKEHEDFYTEPASAAEIAVVSDDADNGIDLLNYLAAHNVVFDVLFDRTLTAEQLSRYKLVVVPKGRKIGEHGMELVRQYASSGGKAIYPDDGSKAGVWNQIQAADPDPVLKVQAPASVLVNLVRQPAKAQSVLHVINYSDRPVRDVRVEVKGRYNKLAMGSPDRAASDATLGRGSPGYTKVRLPVLDLYTVLALR